MNIRRGSVTIRDIFLTQKKTMFSLNFTYIFGVKQKSGDLRILKNCPKQNLNNNVEMMIFWGKRLTRRE